MLPSICHRLRFLYVVVVSLVNAFVPVTLWKVRRYTSHLRSTRPSSASSSSLPGTSSIEYVVGSIDFASLQQIGLNISSDLANRNSIPLHITTPADIFCNRELNMQLIQVIGFDMDWTLALYNEEFDMLAFEGAKEKLVHWLGYPKDVLDLKYELNMCRRGCIIDKTSGNILKLDQHRYVREVEHGITPLDAEQRKTVYRASYQEFETFNGKNFVNIDTPFSLVDGSLFMLLVDLKDKLAAALNSRDQADDSKDLISARSQLIGKSYSQVWNDMRKCIDRCHKDGVIKDIVAQNPSKYITYDRHCKCISQPFLFIFVLSEILLLYIS